MRALQDAHNDEGRSPCPLPRVEGSLVGEGEELLRGDVLFAGAVDGDAGERGGEI
jgi:hypothetical protein